MCVWMRGVVDRSLWAWVDGNFRVDGDTTGTPEIAFQALDSTLGDLATTDTGTGLWAIPARPCLPSSKETLSITPSAVNGAIVRVVQTHLGRKRRRSSAFSGRRPRTEALAEPESTRGGA